MPKIDVVRLKRGFRDILENLLMLDFGEDGYYEGDLDEWVDELLREVKNNIK